MNENTLVTLEVRSALCTYDEHKTINGKPTSVRRSAPRGKRIEVDREQADKLLALEVVHEVGASAPATSGGATPGAAPLPQDAIDAITAASGIANLSDEDADEEKGEDPVAKPPSDTVSVAGLVQKIDGDELNAKSTIALAGGDPGMAALVIEAEKARDGDPRSTVIKPLEKVIADAQDK